MKDYQNPYRNVPDDDPTEEPPHDRRMEDKLPKRTAKPFFTALVMISLLLLFMLVRCQPQQYVPPAEEPVQKPAVWI